MTYFSKSLFCMGVTSAAVILFGCAEASSSDSSSPQNAAEFAASEVAATEMLQAGNWEIVSEASHIRFTAQQEGQAFTGSFSEFSGVINFNPDAPETGAVRIEVPLSSIDAGSKDRNSTLPGKVWFSTKKFPVAVFTSDDLSRDGEGYLAKGELKMKGVSVPLDIPFDLTRNGDQAVMTGAVTLDRTDWDVGAAPWNTDEWVSKGVKLDLKVTANRDR